MQFPKDINAEQSDNYVLSIRITPTVFFFCVYRVDTKELVYSNEISFSSINNRLGDIEQIIFDSEFLTYPYRRTNVIFVSTDYELAPQYLIQKDKKEILYNFTHLEPAKQILYCSDTIQQIVTVYNTEKDVYTFLSRNIYNCEFYHHSNLLMQYIEDGNKEDESSQKMYLNFHDEFVDVFCYNDKSQILHVLTFENENEKNMVYHILNIWDKCGYDQNSTPLYIFSGYGGINLYVSNRLKEYIKNIHNMPVGGSLNSIKTRECDRSLPLDYLILNAR